MPPNDRSRPAKAAPEVTAATNPSIARHPDIPPQLRRRRAASRRLPELDDGTGRSDPIDPVRRGRQPITVRVLGQWTAEADGPQVVRILDRLGCQRMRARTGGMWQFPARHLDDFLAYAEHLGIPIEATL